MSEGADTVGEDGSAERDGKAAPMQPHSAAEPMPKSPLPSPAVERIEPRTLELLVCPLTRTTLEYDPQRQELISRRANLAYPIKCGVPLLTRDAARNLDEPPA